LADPKPMYLVTFPGQHQMASTFLRFSEHNESPKFRGSVFTHEEFLAWYASVQPATSYVDYWDGFNVPARALEPFRAGRFDPLTEDERKLLDLLADVPPESYVIGAIEGDRETIIHEVVHGLFALDAAYRAEALAALETIDLTALKACLQSKDGYHEDVLDDEVIAHALTGWGFLEDVTPEAHQALETVREAVGPIFLRHFGAAPTDHERLQALTVHRPFR
jgi:hypothetical protein